MPPKQATPKARAGNLVVATFARLCTEWEEAEAAAAAAQPPLPPQSHAIDYLFDAVKGARESLGEGQKAAGRSAAFVRVCREAGIGGEDADGVSLKPEDAANKAFRLLPALRKAAVEARVVGRRKAADFFADPHGSAVVKVALPEDAVSGKKRARGGAAGAAVAGGGKEEEGDGDDDDEEEEGGEGEGGAARPAGAKRHKAVGDGLKAVPSKMSVAELKAELATAGVSGSGLTKKPLVEAVEYLRQNPQPDAGDQVLAGTVFAADNLPPALNGVIMKHGGQLTSFTSVGRQFNTGGGAGGAGGPASGPAGGPPRFTHIYTHYRYQISYPRTYRHGVGYGGFMPLKMVDGTHAAIVDHLLPVIYVETDRTPFVTEILEALQDAESRAAAGAAAAQADGPVADRENGDDPDLVARIRALYPPAAFQD